MSACMSSNHFVYQSFKNLIMGSTPPRSKILGSNITNCNGSFVYILQQCPKAGLIFKQMYRDLAQVHTILRNPQTPSIFWIFRILTLLFLLKLISQMRPPPKFDFSTWAPIGGLVRDNGFSGLPTSNKYPYIVRNLDPKHGYQQVKETSVFSLTGVEAKWSRNIQIQLKCPSILPQYFRGPNSE